jgi:hypothetical protein
MAAPMTKLPFEASLDELEVHLDAYVDAIFSSLESEFLIVPRGEGFVDYESFEAAYQALKRRTAGFEDLDPDHVVNIALQQPLTLIVLRTMLGFTPPEWAYVASQHCELAVAQGYVRALDRRIRMDPTRPAAKNARIEALVRSACDLLRQSAPEVGPSQLHRLDKADTREGLHSIRHLSNFGVPYPMLLYERFLGRSFAGHRDSVSELIGGGLETAIEEQLAKHGVSFRKTKRAEKMAGFDQSPDFIVPDEFAPKVVIEAKLTEDDGTARDKITRVQHLDRLSRMGQEGGGRKFQVVACIAGRGFGVRREDMKKLLLATDGKVFTLKTLDRMVECSGLQSFTASE